MGLRRDLLCYWLGIACLAAVGFLSPCWWLGFAPLGAGLLWAYWDVVEVGDDGDSPPTPRRH